jgi:hypothetical protein
MSITKQVNVTLSSVEENSKVGVGSLVGPMLSGVTVRGGGVVSGGGV